MIVTGVYYDVDSDQSSASCPPRHLDPGERGESSGRTLPAAFAHLVDKDLVENYLAKRKEVSVVDLEEALLRDGIGKKPLN